MYYVYLLKSLVDGQYYIGQTQDVEARVKLHNAGQVRSTRHRAPLVLVGSETYDSRDQARYREYQLKHHSDQKRHFVNALEAGR